MSAALRTAYRLHPRGARAPSLLITCGDPDDARQLAARMRRVFPRGVKLGTARITAFGGTVTTPAVLVPEGHR